MGTYELMTENQENW